MVREIYLNQAAEENKKNVLALTAHILKENKKNKHQHLMYEFPLYECKPNL